LPALITLASVGRNASSFDAGWRADGGRAIEASPAHQTFTALAFISIVCFETLVKVGDARGCRFDTGISGLTEKHELFYGIVAGSISELISKSIITAGKRRAIIISQPASGKVKPWSIIMYN
jgi:hypothetical protein